MQPLCSLITIANKEAIYEKFLCSLKTQQGVDFEILTVFNYHNEERSAREAYNRMAHMATGQYLIFLHPDIRFLSNSSLYEIMRWVTSAPLFGVIGVAGADAPTVGHMSTLYSNIYNGEDKHRVGNTINELHEIQTVDECMFIVDREYFMSNPFGTRLGWHLYAVEYCLQCQSRGRRNFVAPADAIWHLSDGRSLDPSYVKQVRDLMDEYCEQFDCIYTTVKAWKTRGVRAHIYNTWYYYKQWLKKMILWKESCSV